MRRIALWLVGTVVVLVLLFSYRTSTSGPTGGRGGAVVAASPGVVPAAPGSSNSAELVVNGPVANTRWGPVQVQVHISGQRIVDVTVLQQPHGNRQDREINGYALPVLHDEVIQAQSGQIDTVSGATVTSDGYLRSLQAALDAAHFTG